MRCLTAALVLALACSCTKKKADESKDKTAAQTTEPAGEPPALPSVLGAPATPDTSLERATELAKRFIIIDGHVDLPWRMTKKLGKDGKPTIDPGLATEGGEFDHPRAVAGGLDVPFMSIYVSAKFQKSGGAKKKADSLINLVEGLIETHPDKFARAHSPDEAEANKLAGKVSLAMGIENGAAFEDDLANIAHFHKRGIRYVTLTHSKDNLICDSSYDKSRTHKGLSAYGRKVVPELNKVGIMIDVSHVSDDAFHQVLELTKTPVIASHSSARHFIPGFERNMSDEMITKLGKNGGVMMINFGSTFVSKKANDHNERRKDAIAVFKKENVVGEDDDPRLAEFTKSWKAKNPFPFATIAEVADHIDHAVKLAGIDHVGFGSDFDGVGPTLPTDLKDAAAYPALIKLLLERGYNVADIEKLCGSNLLRVWRQVAAFAAKN